MEKYTKEAIEQLVKNPPPEKSLLDYTMDFVDNYKGSDMDLPFYKALTAGYMLVDELVDSFIAEFENSRRAGSSTDELVSIFDKYVDLSAHIVDDGLHLIGGKECDSELLKCPPNVFAMIMIEPKTFEFASTGMIAKGIPIDIIIRMRDVAVKSLSIFKFILREIKYTHNDEIDLLDDDDLIDTIIDTFNVDDSDLNKLIISIQAGYISTFYDGYNRHSLALRKHLIDSIISESEDNLAGLSKIMWFTSSRESPVCCIDHRFLHNDIMLILTAVIKRHFDIEDDGLKEAINDYLQGDIEVLIDRIKEAVGICREYCEKEKDGDD